MIPANLKTESKSTSKTRRFQTFLSLVFILVSISTTFFLIHHFLKVEEEQHRSEFSQVLDETQDKILERLRHYEDVLRSTASFIQASSHVTPEEWQVFSEKILDSQRYPGLIGIGYVRLVKTKELDQIQRIYPNLDVQNLSNRDFHYIYVLSSTSTAPSRGFDASSEISRSQALELSAETNQAVLTNYVNFFGDNRPGYLFYFPVFKDSKLHGWIAAGFEIEKFLTSVVERSTPRALENYIRLEVLEREASGISTRSLFLREPSDFVSNDWEEERLFSHYHARWIIRADLSESFIQNDLQTIRNISILLGFGFNLVLIVLLVHLSVHRDRAYLLAKRMSQRVIDTSETYRSIINNIQEITFQIDQSGRWIFLNPAWEEVTGFKIQESIGKVFLDFIHPDDRIKAMNLFNSLIESKTFNRHEEIQLVAKSGNIIWLEVFAQRIEDENQNSGIMGTLFEISERKKFEEQLLSEKSQLKNFIQSAPVAIAMFDRQMRYIAHSKMWLRDYGLEAESVLGRSHYEVFPNIPENWKEIHRRCLNGESISNPEDVFKNEHSNVYLRWAIEPWYESPDRIGGIVMVTQVINDLVAAREAAFQAMEAKSTFLANMSHEIRTPINGILGTNELLMETDLEEDQYKFTQIIKTSGQHLLQIINDILDVSKMEAGKMELEESEFSLEEVIENQMELLSARAWEKKLLFTHHIDPSLPKKIIGDSGRLSQILVNLLGNAIKFTENGHVILEIKREHQKFIGDDKDIKISFSIYDTGPGIEISKIEDLFQPFVQEKHTARKVQGTGLGLSICRGLVSLMEGEIGAKLNPEGGSIFWFQVPFQMAEASPNIVPKDPPVISMPELRAFPEQFEVCMRKFISENFEINSESTVAQNLIIYFLHPHSELEDLKFEKEMIKLRSADVMILDSHPHPKRKKLLKRLGVKRYLGLPARRSYLINGILGHSESIQQSEKSVASKKYFILLAEDNQVNQMVTRLQLETFGHQVHLVANGQEALDAYQQFKFDLILMDCQMPEMDGFEATEQIRKLEIKSKTHIPIVALTAQALHGDREKCIEAGFDSYLSKPCSKDSLQACIQEILSGEKLISIENITNSESFDASRIESLVQLGGDDSESFINHLIQLYSESCKKFVDDMQSALKNFSRDSIKRSAHSLKSSSANLGGKEVASLCKTLEENCDQYNFDRMNSEVKKIMLAIQKHLTKLEDFQKTELKKIAKNTV